MHEHVEDDWLVECIDDMIRAAELVSQRLNEFVASVKVARADRLAGGPLQKWVEAVSRRGGRQTRLASAEAIKGFEHVVMVFRSKTVRALVDDEGMTLTEVARLLQTTRQNIARLYRATEGL
jgi:hypothetical protein